MIRNRYCVLLFSLFHFTKPNMAWAGNDGFYKAKSLQDTIVPLDLSIQKKINSLNSKLLTSDSLNMDNIKKNPNISLGDLLKGQGSGMLVQTPSAEPGVFQNILLRGLSSVQLSNRDIGNNAATIYVNGVPMGIENAFSYDIQLFDYNRIGPATDYSSSLSLHSIKSIEVIKDPIRLAELGPLANNGVIWITTYGGKTGAREISVNSYFGINTKPSISPINAHYENLFRQNFYNRYGTLDDKLKYPGYLADSTNLNYYGASDWNDLYYSNAANHNIDLTISGGSDRANFGFFGGYTRNAISSDNTGLDRYNVLFNVNMLPFSWFKVTTFINARRLERDRNSNLRDRYAEMAYLPDLSTPLAPSKTMYDYYKSIYNNTVVDENVTNHVTGNIGITLDLLKGLSYSTNFSLDYNEGIRDLFYPSTLMETINYMSTYYGYSQRFMFSNGFNYNVNFDEHKFNLAFSSDYSEDLFRYNFARAYDGPNDYIKLNVVGTDGVPRGGLRVLRYNNKEQFHLHSLSGKIGYNYNDLVELRSVLRWDGSSTVQPDSRWIFTPSADIKWNLDKHLDTDDLFNIKLGFARIAKPAFTSRYASGPQYSSNLGWSQDPTISSYFGYAGISRDYSFGWSGYNLQWAFSDNMELSLNNSFFDNRLSTTFSLYQRDDKNQIALVPVPNEFGYVGEYQNGLSIRNQGFEGYVNGVLLKESDKKLGWNLGINFNLNRNEITSLPNNLTDLQIGNRLLKVGESVDAFWLFQNNGIYLSQSEIPVQNGSILNNNGVPFEVGDAKWYDRNQDNIINDDDKVFKGRFTPKFFGGINNSFAYNGFDLDMSFTYALGVNALNQRASSRYNFVNNEANNNIDATREIFHWQQDIDITKYPIYNVWSGTSPYRVDQDLFLENASYLKLRSVSFGYDLTRLKNIAGTFKNLRRAYIYLNANNLYTLTKFSGTDPELVNFNGMYDGYGLPLTKTYTLGVKLDF